MICFLVAALVASIANFCEAPKTEVSLLKACKALAFFSLAFSKSLYATTSCFIDSLITLIATASSLRPIFSSLLAAASVLFISS